jgi:protein SCO1
MRRILSAILLFLCFASSLFAKAVSLQGRVVEVLQDTKSLRVELTKVESVDLSVGDVVQFRVGPGDLEIGYATRLIRAEAVHYNNAWHLEKVFPVDGAGAKAMRDVNQQLHDVTSTMSRRKYTRQGDYIPNFAMIDQDGNFLQIRELRGNAFVLNFIFTRCQVATMCPASSTRMSELQDAAREVGFEKLDLVTITFDPEFDSPGILRQYAKGYGIELDNFHLLTGTRELVDDLLRQFGIITMDEDGTINHTAATLLVDANGRVAYRKEGSTWTVAEFLKEAQDL